jgi:hypothetical protein
MNKLEQLHLFLKFHFAPDSEAKRTIWEAVADGMPYTDSHALLVCEQLVEDIRSFDEDDIKFLNIVASPPAFATNDVELAMRLTEALVEYDKDPEAAHVTADEFLVALVEELGHPAVAATYRGINKWSA